MDPTEGELSRHELHDDAPQSLDSNDPLKPSNGHAIRSVADIKMEDLDGEQASIWQKQPQPYMIPKRKGKRKTESLIAVFCQWIVEHQIGLAVNLLMLLALTHLCFPRARRHTRKFFQLSYFNASSGKYALGWDDLPLVFYWIAVFTGLRAAVMDYALLPFAQMAGIEKKKEKVRFAEQAWIFLYATASWSLGMYIMYNSDYWLNLPQMWADWPDREMNGLAKWYYLVQFAFWLQQILVVNIEERRKDYAQMFTHHIFTSLLIFYSYGYHQTRVGNVILCLMDVVDILFPLAKMLKYLKFRLLCDVVFGLFMVVWVVTRHVFFPLVIWSLYADSAIMIKDGCYWGPTDSLHGPIDSPNGFSHLLQPFLNPVGLVCWNPKIKWSFIITLLGLQAILMLWFSMIVRVAIKVIRGGEAEDSRSDDEDAGESEEDCNAPEMYTSSIAGPAPIQEDVGAGAITYRRTSPPRRTRKGGATASGVTLPSDRKELLGRIGCDKGAS